MTQPPNYPDSSTTGAFPNNDEQERLILCLSDIAQHKPVVTPSEIRMLDRIYFQGYRITRYQATCIYGIHSRINAKYRKAKFVQSVEVPRKLLTSE